MGITTILNKTRKATSKAAKQAENRLKEKNKGLALGLSKNKDKTIAVEMYQSNIRKKAKNAGVTVKKYRMDNPNDRDVKKLYEAKPLIKKGDMNRAKNR